MQTKAPTVSPKRLALQFAVLVILLGALMVYVRQGRALTWPDGIIDVLPIAVLLSFAILIGFRAWQNKSGNDK